MSEEGPLLGFDAIHGRYHLHTDTLLVEELDGFISHGAGIMTVEDSSFKIVDYCNNGPHPHDNGSWSEGGNVELKPIKTINIPPV